MADIDTASGNLQPADPLLTLTHVIYALHAFTVVTGILSSAFILTAFLTGWPSILAVILNYLKRDEARGTYLESHFRWQIRTFWFALFWVAIAWLFIFTLFGIPLGAAIFIIAGLWVLYRIARGWLRLVDRQAMPFQE